MVYFLDETFEELAYDASTTVMEAVEQLAGQIKLENYQTFSLFAVYKVGAAGCRRWRDSGGCPARLQRRAFAAQHGTCLTYTHASHHAAPPAAAAAQGKAAEEPGMPASDEVSLMDDNRFISDIMCAGGLGGMMPRGGIKGGGLCCKRTRPQAAHGREAGRHCPAPFVPLRAAQPTRHPPARPRRYEFKQQKAKAGLAAKLLFKKRMFRETDETVTEPQFVNLSYIQAQHDYLQVGRAARMPACLPGYRLGRARRWWLDSMLGQQHAPRRQQRTPWARLPHQALAPTSPPTPIHPCPPPGPHCAGSVPGDPRGRGPDVRAADAGGARPHAGLRLGRL